MNYNYSQEKFKILFGSSRVASAVCCFITIAISSIPSISSAGSISIDLENSRQSNSCADHHLQSKNGSNAHAEILVTAGAFTMGSDHWYANESPAREAKAEKFWIDKYEVTNLQFAKFVKATKYVTTAERSQTLDKGDGTTIELPPGSAVFHSPTHLTTGTFNDWWDFLPGASWNHPEGPQSNLIGKMNHPVVHVSLIDARHYAQWANREIPSEKQWEYAAKYDVGESSPSSNKDVKPIANTWEGVFPIKNTQEDGFEEAAPVGCYQPNGAGVHDMIGNVWEWVSDHYSSPDSLNGLNFDTAEIGTNNEEDFVIKGGSFLCSKDFCYRSRAEARLGVMETYTSSHIGFRTIRKSSSSAE